MLTTANELIGKQAKVKEGHPLAGQIGIIDLITLDGFSGTVRMVFSHSVATLGLTEFDLCREMSPSFPKLEAEVVQTAIRAHCKPEDSEAQDDLYTAVSALIEARFQSVKSSPPSAREDDEMPTRIWIDSERGMAGYINEQPPPESNFKYEYVRADRLAQVEQERDKLREQLTSGECPIRDNGDCIAV